MTRARLVGGLVGLSLAACGSATAASPETITTREPPRWTTLESPTSESLRGLSVVSETVVWASGAHGTVLRSIDGGASWSAAIIAGAEALDFRSLHAFDGDRAVVLAAGAPARAFRTDDGGAHWIETYTRDVPGIFFDSLAFWDEHEGIAIGDPLEGASGLRFAVLLTHDGGAHWEEREGPLAEVGEAAFAASNGVIALPAPATAIFATGGLVSHVFRGSNGEWARADSSVASGLASAGVFAIAFRDVDHGYVVGGDYAQPTTAGSFARSVDGGRTWDAGAPLRGFRSSIVIADGALLVVGTSGSEVSRDDGASWTTLGEEPFNAVGAAGSTAFAVGPAGRLARLALAPEAR
jgi:photosystem II stability/assembly factor-like uncharacterized protein